MSGEPPRQPMAPADAAPIVAADSPVAMELIPAQELADLRLRADRYRFMFRTIVMVTSIIVGALLIIFVLALLVDT